MLRWSCQQYDVMNMMLCAFVLESLSVLTYFGLQKLCVEQLKIETIGEAIFLLYIPFQVDIRQIFCQRYILYLNIVYNWCSNLPRFNDREFQEGEEVREGVPRVSSNTNIEHIVFTQLGYLNLLSYFYTLNKPLLWHLIWVYTACLGQTVQ